MPAQVNGLRAGDEIIEIDGIKCKGKSISEVSDLLRGKPQTELTIKVQREGHKKPITKTFLRDIIQMPTVPFYAQVAEGVGYIVILDFIDRTASDFEIALNELTTISGQKAVVTYSKKDISNFKLRKGMPIGVRVTLRDDRMYEFMERLIAVALPRIRDFKGINDKLDGKGNYTLGIQEQIIYPEIDIDKISRIFGMEITFVTSTKNDTEAYALLKAFGLPFKNAKKNE